MSYSWNPLSEELLSSSVLANGPDVVAVWALLIASANRDGHSTITVPYVASVLRITDERALLAFEKLQAPDPMSRNKDSEGRRIKAHDGGWYLVSHAKYRVYASRAGAAARQAKYAAKRRLEADSQILEATGRLRSRLRTKVTTDEGTA